MRTIEEVRNELLQKFEDTGVAQVEGYNSFGFIRRTDNGFYISREAGEDTYIPNKKLDQAIDAVRQDPSVYSGGPSKLRFFGITHVNSPLWAVLHLIPLNEYKP